MTPREIIAEAWAITLREKQIRRWGFTSAIFETLLSLKLLSYQAYFLYEYLGGRQAGFFDIEIAIMKSMPVWASVSIIGSFILLVAIELFMPHMCLGAIIGLSAKAYQREEVKGGLVLALYNFFPIFAIHEFFVLSSLSLLITTVSLVLRYVEGDIKFMIVTVAVILFVISNIVKFLFSFAEESVVIRKAGLFRALGASFKLIISHLGHIMFLVVLLVVISLRIAINMLIMLLLPGAVLGLGFLLTLFLPAVLSYVITGIVGTGLIILASYFFAYLHVFKQTVWTITYLELSKKPDLDVILPS